jgi:aldehyde dehydrogenase (NAD+)
MYTGASSVGSIVMAAASKFLTPVTLELGGKSPVIVTAKADIVLAAKRNAWGKLFNTG